jgi:hypothetical protein
MLDKLEQDLIIIDLKERPQRYGRVIGNSKLYVIISKENDPCIIWHPSLKSKYGWLYEQEGFEGWKGWYTNDINRHLKELCDVLYPETIKLINETLSYSHWSRLNSPMER